MVAGSRGTIINTNLAKIIAVVDIGNSAIKINQVQDGELAGLPLTFPLEHAGQLASQEPLAATGRVVIGCSGSQTLAENLAAQIFARGDEALILARNCALPFKNDYAAGQAGVDRLANVAAGIQSVQNGSTIIVDAGSAITVEKVAPSGHFRGGVILPGFALQARALNQNTAELPLIQPHSDDGSVVLALPGIDTETAISAGIYHSCTGAVELIVREYLVDQEMQNAQIIITGGDAAMLAGALERTFPRVQIDTQLTLRGLLALAGFQS